VVVSKGAPIVTEQTHLLENSADSLKVGTRNTTPIKLNFPFFGNSRQKIRGSSSPICVFSLNSGFKKGKKESRGYFIREMAKKKDAPRKNPETCQLSLKIRIP